MLQIVTLNVKDFNGVFYKILLWIDEFLIAKNNRID